MTPNEATYTFLMVNPIGHVSFFEFLPCRDRKAAEGAAIRLQERFGPEKYSVEIWTDDVRLGAIAAA